MAVLCDQRLTLGEAIKELASLITMGIIGPQNVETRWRHLIIRNKKNTTIMVDHQNNIERGLTCKELGDD